MSPPPWPEQAYTGGEIKRVLALKFQKIGKMSHFYLTTDLDQIALQTITDDIRYLEQLRPHFKQVQQGLNSATLVEFKKIAGNIEGQVHKIIPLFYSARHSLQHGDRKGYYQNMQASRWHWQNIRDLLRRKLA
jgi:hypothetical protein